MMLTITNHLRILLESVVLTADTTKVRISIFIIAIADVWDHANDISSIYGD